jgi:nitroreductase
MHTIHTLAEEIRENKFGISSNILYRWSPRSMTGEGITRTELLPLLEAARWAPSSFNNQPWRFYYACRDSSKFNDLFNLLMGKNQAWCRNAGCLLIAVSKTTFDYNGKPMKTHAHDAGAAWMAFALEGVRRNYVVHGMAGFNYEAAKKYLNLSDEYQVNCMIAVGKSTQEIETENVSQRKNIEDIVIELK